MLNKIKKITALSLIEILWAVVILSIITVTVTGVFTGILVSSKKSEKFVVATNLAASQMDCVKLMGSFDIPSTITLDGKFDKGVDPDGNGAYFPPHPPYPYLLQENVDGVTYYYKITTSFVSGTGNKLLRILITVYWDDKNNEGKNFVTLEMFKRK